MVRCNVGLDKRNKGKDWLNKVKSEFLISYKWLENVIFFENIIVIVLIFYVVKWFFLFWIGYVWVFFCFCFSELNRK